MISISVEQYMYKWRDYILVAEYEAEFIKLVKYASGPNVSPKAFPNLLFHLQQVGAYLAALKT